MTHYIALIHKDPDSCYGVSFPDIPGVFTAGDTIEEGMQQAAEVLRFAPRIGPIRTARRASNRPALSTCYVVTPSLSKNRKTQ
jgi:hypothetical protein